MEFPYGETVEVLTAGTTTDPYSGEPSADWENPTERTVDLVGVADGGTAEPLQDARNELNADYDLFFPADDPIARTDRVRVRGDVCEVVGKPFAWRSPFTGWAPGLVVHVKLSEG